MFFNLNAKEVVKECAGASKSETTSGPGQLSGEFSLRSHDLYLEYLDVIERHFEKFLEKEGIDSARLLRELREFQRDKLYVGLMNMLAMLIASWEFSAFIDACQNHIARIHEDDSKDGDGKRDEYKDAK